MLCLGWWDELPPERILDAARRLKDRSKARHLVISCHHRPSFELMARTPGLEGIMVRYNAAHPGAERDVFPLVANTNPGVIAFTATRWGSLLDPKLVPSGEPVPRASDCYRFVLTHPSVHTTLAGPKDGAELDEAMAALDRGPMDPEELAWMKRVGLAVRGDTKAHRAMEQIDRARSFLTGGGRRSPGQPASDDLSPPLG
jgi:aryl-alcohol dehydrogenase-like predicted oxidoreductase